MGDRIYTAPITSSQTVGTPVQDIISVKAGSANGIQIHYIELNASGQTSPSEINLRLKRLGGGGTITAGSGGGALTASPVDEGESKSSAATIRAGDTTQATMSGGTNATLHTWNWNVLLPFQYLPAPEDRPCCQAGSEFVLDLPASTGASVSILGFIMWEELP